MKIQKIYIKNLNSLSGEHHIDFNKNPLAESTLFAITGPTGSGKSTILDAVCLALYNASPRQDNTITSTSLSKSGALISKGATESVVSVEYTQEDKLYKSQWSIAYNRNGNLNERKQELSFFNLSINDWDLLETNTKVPIRNTQITSLDFIQFTRSVLLAQGQFSALLNAGKEERYSLMEKITGDDIYRKIGKKVFEQYTNLKNNLEEVKKALENIQLLSEEEYLNYEHQLATLEKELILLNEEKNVKSSLKKTKENIDNYTRLLNKVEADLTSWDQENTEFLPNRKRMDLYDSYHPLLNDRDLINQKNIFVKELDQQMFRDNISLDRKEKEIQDKLTYWSDLLHISLNKDTFIEVLSQKMKAIQVGIDDKNKKNEGYQTALSEQIRAQQNYENSEKEKIEKSQLVLQNQANKEEAWTKIETFKADIPLFEKLPHGQQIFNSLVTHRNTLFKELGIDLQIKLEDARNTVEKEEQNLFAQLEAIRKLGERSKIEQAFDENIEVGNQLGQILFQLRHILKLEDDLKKILQNNASLEEELTSLKNQSAATEEEIIQHSTALSEIEKIIALAAKEKDLALLRENLVEGEPCPLCGSIHHPGITEISDQLLSSKRNFLDTSLKNLNRAKEDTLKKISQHSAEKGSNESRIEEITNQKESFLRSEQTLKFLNVKEDLTISLEKLNTLLKVNSTQKEEIQSIKTALNKLDSLQEKWQKEKDKLYLFDNLEVEKAEILSFFIENLNISDFNEIKPFLQDLSKKHVEYKRLEDEYRQLEKDLDLNKTVLDGIIKNIQKNLEELNQRKEATHEAHLLLKEAIERLDQLPKIENPLNHLVEEPIAIQQLLSDSSSLTKEITKNNKEKGELEVELSGLNNLFVQNIQKAGFSSPEALESINLTPDERKEFRSKKDQLDQRYSSHQTNKNNYKEELKKLELQDNPEINLSQITNELEHLEKSFSNLFTQKGSIGQILETDRRARIKYEKELLEIEKKKKALRPYELLNTMIGDAQGKKFNEYAQELTLKRLLQATNQNLALINARYLLDMPQKGENDSDLYVIDQYMGNNRRAAKSTLSGGESFLVSLSMALGLSDLASGKAELGNLFIDEGFGSLDPATLESAISMLEEIQYRRGRRIGIISHVSELKERITTQIRVTPTLGGNSSIECV